MGEVASNPYLKSRTKRVFDITVSLLGIVPSILLFPFIAALIKAESHGPVLYRQFRLGMDGRQFVLYKFRTMVEGAEVNGSPVWASVDDPRTTRVGRVLRKLYLDELPQFWNVLKNDMSIVGPRPERPELASIITESHPFFSERLEAKPGITGIAQTEYKYTASVADSRHKLTFDRKYINRASLFLDLWVIVRTVRRVLVGFGT